MNRVAIVDHGFCNLLSVQRAVEHLGAEAQIIRRPEEVLAAEGLILPGVGAFADAMQALDRLGLSQPLRQRAAGGAPLLGICLGMQLLFEQSEEFGLWQGLGILPGRVVRLPERDAAGAPQRVPQVGWNGLLPPRGAQAFAQDSPLGGTPPGSQVYFVHSYAAAPARPQDLLAEVEFGGRRVCAAVCRGRVAGCQFHPEKSGEVGLGILRRFLQQG